MAQDSIFVLREFVMAGRKDDITEDGKELVFGDKVRAKLHPTATAPHHTAPHRTAKGHGHARSFADARAYNLAKMWRKEKPAIRRPRGSRRGGDAEASQVHGARHRRPLRPRERDAPDLALTADIEAHPVALYSCGSRILSSRSIDWCNKNKVPRRPTTVSPLRE